LYGVSGGRQVKTLSRTSEFSFDLIITLRDLSVQEIFALEWEVPRAP
jgi:hypothetical protein